MLGVDESVGKVLEALRRHQILDKTMVIFTSDNGHMLGERGIMRKRSAFEDSIRVPLVIRYPRWFRARSTSRELALNIDIPVTILEAAGVGPLQGMSGRSLADLTRSSFYYQYFREPAQTVIRCIPTLEAVRSKTHKLVHLPDQGGRDELYDLTADPDELRNTISDPEYAPVRSVLERELRSCYGN
jgi:arylsulfatase A-like enzyme